MKWLKSTTQKSYMLDGHLIPQCITKDNDYLSLTDAAYDTFLQNCPVIKSLIKSGAILVTDKEPQTASQQVSHLTTERAQLLQQITNLQIALNVSQKNQGNVAELDAARTTIAELQASVRNLEDEVALQKQRNEELTKEAQEKIDALEAQLSSEDE